jgi:hypothetical protein
VVHLLNGGTLTKRALGTRTGHLLTHKPLRGKIKTGFMKQITGTGEPIGGQPDKIKIKNYFRKVKQKR